MLTHIKGIDSMLESLNNLYNNLTLDPNLITGRFIDAEGKLIESVFEVFVKNTEIPVKNVMDNIKNFTGLKVVRNECKRYTFVVAEWGLYDCHKCGLPMSAIQRENGWLWFCNQCVEFKKE